VLDAGDTSLARRQSAKLGYFFQGRREVRKGVAHHGLEARINRTPGTGRLRAGFDQFVCARDTLSLGLERDEIQRGKRTVLRKIARLQPAVVAFVGASIYRYFCTDRASSGVGPKPETICGARVFVLPNPSGLNANFLGFKDKMVWFEKLCEFAELGAVREADKHM
jgi:Uracil DNA glycosylase superfamily